MTAIRLVPQATVVIGAPASFKHRPRRANQVPEEEGQGVGRGGELHRRMPWPLRIARGRGNVHDRGKAVRTFLAEHPTIRTERLLLDALPDSRAEPVGRGVQPFP